MIGRRKRKQTAAAATTPDLVVDTVDERFTVPATVANELRYAVAGLQHQGDPGVPRTIGLTSAVRGEGVTTTCRSLAAVLAHDHFDRRVCVVDLDWWSPSSPSEAPGIAQVVAGEVSLDNVVVQTNNPRLWHVPAGVTDPNERPALASSDKLHQALDELSFHLDHVLLDLPPVLATSETVTLASLPEACLLVVRHGATAVTDLGKALDHLRGLPILGGVLNGFDQPIPDTIVRHLSSFENGQATPGGGHD